MLDLIGAEQRVVDALDHLRDRVDRVKGLVGIHLAPGVGVGGDLPAGKVNGLEAGLGHLNTLVAGEGAERVDVMLGVEAGPELFRAEAGDGVLDMDRAADLVDVFGGVGALHAGKAGRCPNFFDGCDCLLLVWVLVRHGRSPVRFAFVLR